MYHYITLGDIRIYMTWLWIIAFLLVFITATWRYGKKYHLDISLFMYYLPLYILCIYLWSSYMRYFIEYTTIIPLRLSWRLQYLSPYNYEFHLVGITLWFIAAGMHFLSHIAWIEKRSQRVDTWFHAISLWCIPLWVFLLLGDNFIGLSTSWSFFVSAIRSDSAVAIYGKVIPLWLVLSMTGLAIHTSFYLRQKRTQRLYGYLWLSLFCLCLALILLYQQYPRHIVMKLWSLTMDVKQYVLIAISIALFVSHKKTHHTSQAINKHSE